jgi:uncharacterized HAD superfamily protein
MLRLGIDLDGCLYDWHVDLRNWVLLSTGKLYPKPTGWNFAESEWGMPQEEFTKHWYEGVLAGVVFRQQDPDPVGVEVLRRLHNQGHELYIITSRLLPEIEEACIRNTLGWIDDHKIPHTEVHIVGHGKAEICDKLEIDVMIDDAAHNYTDLLATDTLPVLMTQPWNEHLEADIRVGTWTEFEEVVEWFNLGE